MRILASLFLALATLASPVQAEIPISEIARYLNSFRTAQAAFTQVNSDGTISTGDLSLRRPGRARFDYDAPNKSLVIAGGGQVAVFDPVSNTPPEQYPLSQTPLSLILAEQVDLNSDMVVRHGGDATQTAITLQDPENPQYGNIQLIFTPSPTTLRQWVITDDTGTQTTVILGDMEADASLASGLFNIPLEMQRRGLSE
ncbi:LolA family protein [Jannaschia seohaensis]|uniref:Outer membrane lipoprotein-sorting protein n=1 Tax=Jannaschia seohaensis TaxID=475081 RepID=A0A2Y9A2V8_9RHOB|nr:outer membrane lipoprotein carrier protein LolA [Jannaschia seohaensis]PWJ22257.1 outer membrane lipoprotein-sorting protein [Jannaschia seohaensis]SSA38535.1 Outer membrane lipoprotein-sorting protein [Jannaschia seohaensis]